MIKSKITWCTKIHEIVTRLQEKRQPTETNPKITQVMELADKDFKVVIITMLNKVKENMLVVNEKKQNLKKETTKKNEKEINKLKNIICKIKIN